VRCAKSGVELRHQIAHETALTGRLRRSRTLTAWSKLVGVWIPPIPQRSGLQAMPIGLTLEPGQFDRNPRSPVI
jgi:hypothetical protein